MEFDAPYEPKAALELSTDISMWGELWQLCDLQTVSRRIR
jgi:hypothetical protein